MTMTNRQFFEAIAATQELSDELRNFAEEAIVKLDRKTHSGVPLSLKQQKKTNL